MKKTKIAIGVVVALGVIWTGTAWFTGKQFENHIDELVQQANAQLNEIAPDSRLSVSYQNYQRGVFHSSAQFVIQARSQTKDNAVLKPGQSLVFNERIDHGPFPFAQLKKFNLVPSMASVHTELANTPLVQKLFDLTNGASIIQADTRIGYRGASVSSITLLPVDFQNTPQGEHYVWSGGTLDIDSDADGDQVKFASDIKTISLSSKNEDNMPVLFNFDGFKLSGKTHLSTQGVRVGDQSMTLKSMTASANGQDMLALEGVNVASTFDANDPTISGKINIALNNLKLQQQSFGQGALSVTLSHFDGQALKTFSENYNNQMISLLNQPGMSDDSERYQEGVRQILTTNLPGLLKGNPELTIAPLSWKNDKGESTFNLTVHFNDPGSVSGDTPGTDISFSRVLKTLDSKLVINMDMATEMMKHVAMIEGYQDADANKLADQQIKGLAAMGQMFKLTTQQDGNIVASLQYAADQVTMNGEKMTLMQFLSRYMLGGSPAAEDVTP